ncbi:hypothetical protein Vafri_21297, partial [Volvox africanus]
ALATVPAAASVGRPVAQFGAATAVAVGIASAEYTNWVCRRAGVGTSAYGATGGALSVASGRLSFMYGFTGPAVSVDTACSSSLIGSHWALRELLAGSCRAAVAAGVGILLSPDPTAMFQKAGMLSPEGRCKTLDAAADGYVRGEAVGALVLAALSLEGHIGGRDGDGDGDGDGGERASCLALVRASSVNQDGRSSSLTAPNGPAQQAVVRAAL